MQNYQNMSYLGPLMKPKFGVDILCDFPVIANIHQGAEYAIPKGRELNGIYAIFIGVKCGDRIQNRYLLNFCALWSDATGFFTCMQVYYSWKHGNIVKMGDSSGS